MPAPRPARGTSPARGGRDDTGRDIRFLTGALRIAADDGTTEARLGRLLDLVGRTAGATEVAVIVERGKRRMVVWRGATTGDGGRSLGRWLDQFMAPRTGRAAAPTSFVAIAATADDDMPVREGLAAGEIGAADRTGTAGEIGAAGDTGTAADGDAEAMRRSVVAPGRPRAALGFGFPSVRPADSLQARFPPPRARAAADLVAALVQQLEQERELAHLRHSDAERRRFVSVVAHELRTPLASLSGYLDLMAPDGGGEFLDRSRDLVAGMATLVADLLELSRLEAGQLHLVAAPFSGAEVAQSAVRDVTPLAMERAIDIDAVLAPRLRTVHADRRRIQQVLVNLLGNAIKFSPQGSRVAISLRFDGPVALYTVQDEGPGVPAEDRELIFEPFHRAAGTERVVGTGLGLPIARDLARRMGGDLDVASVPGSGSTFVVALPATEHVDRATVLGRLALALEAAGPVGSPA